MFKSKSLAAILSRFNDTVSQLETLATDNEVTAEHKAESARGLWNEANALKEEAATARQVAENIKNIIKG